MTGNKRSESGQVLLITIMLLATALTVVLSVSFRSSTETQVTKLEEESQKALAAAEAGIEAALKQTDSVPIGAALSSDLSAFSGSALCATTYDKNYFISPLLQKDEQYTFYFANYPDLTTEFWSGNLTLYFKSETSTPAVELTFITTTGVSHYLLDPSTLIQADAGTKTAVDSGSFSLGGISFGYKTSSSFSINNTKLIIARVLSTATKIGIGSVSALKSQGKTCDSQASSNTGVTKKVTLFQSYPQIPAEFFVTSF